MSVSLPALSPSSPRSELAAPTCWADVKLTTSRGWFYNEGMTNDDQFATSPTLLGRLAGGAAGEAWEEFANRYGPAIYAWAWQAGLQESDAADVTQEVLLKLLEKLQQFHYDRSRGSFRGWLKTVTVNAARDCGRRNARLPGGSAGLSGVGDPRLWDELGRRIENEYRRELLEQAEQIVCEKVHASTWQVFELVVKEDVSAAAAAKRIGMTVAEVYVAKSRVMKRLREAVTVLESIDNGVSL